MPDTGCLVAGALGAPEGWQVMGGGGRGFEDGEHVYTCMDSC